MRITMKQIAKEANVSVTTVSHVINDTKSISQETSDRIMKLVKKYNYVPNYSAKNLRSSSTRTAGLIVPSFPDSYVTRYINSISKKAKELNYSLLLVNTDEDPGYEEETLKLFNSQMVDGVILAPATKTSHALSPEIQNLKDSLPIVLVNRLHPGFEGCPSVLQDDYQAGYDAGKHLVYHGHEQIGVIYAVEDISPTNDRVRGFQDALSEKGLPFREEMLVPGHATVEGGKKAASLLLGLHPEVTALFTLNDAMTIGAFSALKHMKKNIPNDIALIGFGDFPTAGLMDPPVTNVNVSPDVMGQTAFDMLLNRINNPDYNKKVLIPTYLVTRRSCGCHL